MIRRFARINSVPHYRVENTGVAQYSITSRALASINDDNTHESTPTTATTTAPTTAPTTHIPQPTSHNDKQKSSIKKSSRAVFVGSVCVCKVGFKGI